MNPYHSFLVSSLPLLAFSSPLHAIEAPDDNASPPVVEPAAEAPIKAEAFLGIISQPVPDLLRDHVNLKPNQGVIVQSVIPDSPADKSGIVVHDIITGLGGKEIQNPEGLSQVIETLKPGEKVSFALIHEGKGIQKEVTLGTRPDHFRDLGKNFPQAGEPLQDLGLPDDFADKILRMVEEGEKGIGFRMLGEDDVIQMPELQKLRQQMKGNMNEMRLEFGGNGGIQGFQGANIRMKDEKGSVEIKSRNDSKEVTVRDPEGEIVWSGPWDTPQDKAAAPAEIRERIDRIDTQTLGGGLKLRFGQPNDR